MIISAPGRAATTIEMVTALERQNPGEPFWIYRSPERPSIGPFYELLRAAAGDDVLLLEDDIVTARNFIRFAAAWPSPHVTSFFHVSRQRLGEPVSPVDFSFAQAVKLPCRVVSRMLGRAGRPHRQHGGGHDDEIGYALEELGEQVIFHRSLVQHVGATSLAWGPDRTLEHRTARDFPGEAFDCLTLL